uniref:Zgc:101559 n=1 Tax=Gouania willdenowi TaxID=441366 RepID=A0A8C5EHM7_GOUWI
MNNISLMLFGPNPFSDLYTSSRTFMIIQCSAAVYLIYLKEGGLIPAYVLFLLTQLQIWDTAGQERFRKSMVEHYYRSVQAVIFVYDVTSLSSFQSIPEWIDECSRHCVGPLVPRILVGNKCDLQGQREVPTCTAQSFADGYSFPLFETSAKDPSEKEHVDAIFLTLAYRLKSRKSLILKQPSVEGVAPLLDQRDQPDGCCQC